jgi:hypothetical protein
MTAAPNVIVGGFLVGSLFVFQLRTTEKQTSIKINPANFFYNKKNLYFTSTRSGYFSPALAVTGRH